MHDNGDEHMNWDYGKASEGRSIGDVRDTSAPTDGWVCHMNGNWIVDKLCPTIERPLHPIDSNVFVEKSRQGIPPGFRLNRTEARLGQNASRMESTSLSS